MKNTPAEKAGLKSGDVIISVNDAKISDPDQLKNLIGNMAPDTKIQVKAIRDKKEKNFTIVLAERNADAVALSGSAETSEDLIGIKVRDFSAQLAPQYELEQDDKGVLITFVKPRSSAAQADLHEGDLIQKVNARDVANVEDYKTAIKDVKPGQTLLLYVKRGKNSLYVGLKVREKTKGKENKNEEEQQPEE
jgi:serine protease Do